MCVALGILAGLVLAEPVAASHDLPPFANSAVDGYALRVADVADAPVTLTVLEEVAAGAVPQQTVEPGTAIWLAAIRGGPTR